MEYQIRHVQEADVAAVHEILLARHVIEGTMRYPYQPQEYTRKRLGAENGVIKLVATDNEKIAGYAELITYPDVPRHRHVGEINMIVCHQDWRGKGVGASLMSAMVSLADDWLQLTRLGLVVWTDNKTAIRLYESFGFAIEGTMPRYTCGKNGYVDAYVMGRLKDLPS